MFYFKAQKNLNDRRLGSQNRCPLIIGGEPEGVKGFHKTDWGVSYVNKKGLFIFLFVLTDMIIML